jgi:diguanylate cyclase (GGDEF)-like protein/PAS domain S-box-containing protein
MPDDAVGSATPEVPDALILVFDRELRLVVAAGQALQGNDHPLAGSGGRPMADVCPSQLWRAIGPLCRSALEGETRSREISSPEHELCLLIDVGPLRMNRDGIEPKHQEQGGGEIGGGVAVLLDITARRHSDALLRSQDQFEQAFEYAPMGMGLLDRAGRWVLVNRALCEIAGYTCEELVGRRFEEMADPGESGRDALGRGQLLAGEISVFQREARYLNAAGETMAGILSVSLVRERDGNPSHFIAQLQDISERKRMEEHLRRLADHDHLTGLRNRRLFEHDVKLQVARSRRHGETAALMLIDLNAFKQINDLHGHKVGDDTLRAVARALTRRLRETDLVARLGGDEFAVLLPHVDREGAEMVADSVVRAIAACTIDVGEDPLHPSASIGFAMIESHSENDEHVLDEADRAMYQAKRARAAARA